MMRWIFIFILSICAISTAHAENTNIEDFLNQLTAHYPVPGAALIVQNGDDRQSYYAGYSALDSENKPIDAQCRFRIGSLTKMYTGFIINHLIAEGKIGLDDKLRDYVTNDLDGRDVDNFDAVTFRHVFNDKSGFADYLDAPFIQDTFLNNRCVEDENQILKFLRDVPAHAKAGAALGYSNTAYVLLGSVLKAQYSQTDLEDIFKAQIFDPFGLTQTGFNSSLYDVFGVERYSAGLPFSSTEVWTGCMRLADGGLFATADDVLTFVNAILRNDKEDNMADTAGVSHWDTELGRFYGHKGRFPGFASAAFYAPEHDVSFVFLVNSGLVNIDAALDEVIKLIFKPDYHFAGRDDLLWFSYQDETRGGKALDLPISDVPPIE